MSEDPSANHVIRELHGQTTDMVERVARALCVEDVHDPAALKEMAAKPPFLGSPNTRWAGYLRVARAAIEAMRDPTEAMELAGWASLHDTSSPHGSPDGCFRAMIDAALNPIRPTATDPTLD